MRLERFTQSGFWLLLGAVLMGNGCAGTPEQLFASSGGAGGSSGGTDSAGSGAGGVIASGGGGTPADGGAAGGDGTGGNAAGADATGGLLGAGGVTGRGGTTNGGAAPGEGGRIAAGGSAQPANGGKGGAANPTSEITQKISKTADDCTWIQRGNQYDERLRYSDTDTWIEVGNDNEQGRIGLRFSLPVPAKATIVSATLELQRLAGSAAASDTLTIHVYDTANVPVFDATHRHGPAAHAAFFNQPVRGTLVGEAGKLMTSADVKALVQHVVDRADFGRTDTVGTIGFVLAPDMTDGWASYGDSSTGSGATLHVSYRPATGG